MIKATITKGKVDMTVVGTPIQLLAEAGVFMENLINDISSHSPEEEETKSLMWDMFLTVCKSRHP